MDKQRTSAQPKGSFFTLAFIRKQTDLTRQKWLSHRLAMERVIEGILSPCIKPNLPFDDDKHRL